MILTRKKFEIGSKNTFILTSFLRRYLNSRTGKGSSDIEMSACEPDEYLSMLNKLDIPQDKINEILKSKKHISYYKNALSRYVGSNKIDKSESKQLYSLSSMLNDKVNAHLPKILSLIYNHELKTTLQLQEVVKRINSSTTLVDLDDKNFKESCGVGVDVSEEEIVKEVGEVIKNNKQYNVDINSNTALGKILSILTASKLRWAPGLRVRNEVDKQLAAARAIQKMPSPKPNSSCNNDTAVKSTPSTRDNNTNEILEKSKCLKFIFEGELSRLHKPTENPQLYPELMEEHLKATKGGVVTRFPPEPNGFLHIGHAKAMNINFGYAQAYNGITYLRYDDTNPGAEEQVYFDSIAENVNWLKFKPYKITNASDYFDQLYELALKLIKKGKAYTCKCTPEKIHKHRDRNTIGLDRECEHRNIPISQTLVEFEKMRRGDYNPGEVSLRMKMDMQNSNPQFWDLVAYRVLKGVPHMRTGLKWNIYPTYDYAHCICDSIENITHSLCTVEFEMSRPSYYWLVNALEIYKPIQWEYGRLSIAHTVLSKRKINQLIKLNIISGWEDPRIWSLASIRRRGFTPEAINAAMRDVGVSKALICLNPDKIEHFARSHLNAIAPRYIMVVNPLKVIIENLPDNHPIDVEIAQPVHPGDKFPKRTSRLTNAIYIEMDDFSLDPSPTFRRLSPGKSVFLMNLPNPITCTDVTKDEHGNVTSVIAKYDFDYNENNTTSSKSYIHWVPACDVPNKNIEVRVINNLFIHPNPIDKVDVPGGWLSDVNPNSLIKITGCVAEPCVYDLKIEDKFQAIRKGYYCVDKDSTPDTLVLNLTVMLKQDSKMKL